jgi:hypothetical protein
MFLNMMQAWAGWLFLFFSFSIVLMWKSIRDDTKAVRAIWFCLLLHHAVVFLNVYIPDASTFHNNARQLAALPEPEWFTNISNGAIVYIHSLGIFYRVFGASIFFGEELSVLAFVLSCVVLLKLIDHLDIRRFRVGIVLVFGLLPTVVIHRSVTLRESWEALFFLLLVYWAIRLQKRPDILNFLFLLMSAFCMAILHHGIRRYVIYLVVISVYWGIFGRKKNVRWSRSVRLLFTGLLIACVIILSQKMGWFMTLGEALEVGSDMRQTLLAYEDVRTNFSLMLDTSSVFGIVTTVPMVFVEYMFAPFPWQVENVKDICAFFESTLRFALLFFALFSWRRSSGEVRSCCGFLLIVVLGMELMWALGTANWGTAVRHHVPAYGIIVLLGGPGLILFMQKLKIRKIERGKVSGESNAQVRHMT